MKIILTFLLFTMSLLSVELEQNYKYLNSEIDNISSSLSAEERISLYYLIMSTHDKIVTSTSIDAKSTDSLENLKTQTLKTFSTLHENNKKLSDKQISKLKTLYLSMISQNKKSMRQEAPEHSGAKTIYTERVVHKNPFITTLMIVFVLFFFLVSLFLGYLLFQSKNHPSIEKFPLVGELEKQNKKLAQQIGSLLLEMQLSKDSVSQYGNELETQNSALSYKNEKLKVEIKELTEALEMSRNSQIALTKAQELEVQNLNEYVESLQCELAKHERK